jgi:hypothetical protein
MAQNSNLPDTESADVARMAIAFDIVKMAYFNRSSQPKGEALIEWMTNQMIIVNRSLLYGEWQPEESANQS